MFLRSCRVKTTSVSNSFTQFSQCADSPSVFNFDSPVLVIKGVSCRYYFLIVWDAQESLVWERFTAFTTDLWLVTNQIAYINTMLSIWTNRERVIVTKRPFKAHVAASLRTIINIFPPFLQCARGRPDESWWFGLELDQTSCKRNDYNKLKIFLTSNLQDLSSHRIQSANTQT